MPSTCSIGLPTLNAALLRSGRDADRQRFVNDFRQAFTELGFATVTGHGIDPDLTAAIFEASRRFHALPGNKKRAVSLNSRHRGFIAMNTSTDRTSAVSRVSKPNQSESFILMREDAPDSPAVLRGDYLAGSNVWPDSPPRFRNDVMAWHDAMAQLSATLLGGIAEALGTTAAEFTQDFDPPTTWLRLLRYPPRPAGAPDDLYGSAPHHDFGAITLLAQDTTPGLEVLHPDGRWLEVKPEANTFILNTGTMLSLYSGSVFRATPHRVINRSGTERFSCAFFYDPNVNTRVQPIASDSLANNESRYNSVHFGEFVKRQLTQSYRQHQDT